MANSRPRRKRTKSRPMDPGSSTEEDMVDVFKSTNPRRTHQKSLMYHIVQYPVLLVIGVLLCLNLLGYILSRTVVNIYEFLAYYLHHWSSYRISEISLAKSKDYDEWRKHALQLDFDLGLEEWKTKASDEPGFDEHLIQRVLRRLKRDRQQGNLEKLIETLRNSACKANLGSIESERIYSKCFYGTKKVVEEFGDEVVEALACVANSEKLSDQEKHKFFKQVNVTYGRAALCLSGGATFTWFHLGVMKALHEQDILPTIITGSSAGSLMAAMVSVRTDDELHEVFSPSLSTEITCLSKSWWEMMECFWKSGALLDDDFYRDEAKFFCRGDTTFLEAYERTGRILNIVVTDEQHSTTKVLNYINSPNITIRSAVVASSAIPGLLPSTYLYSKDPVNGKIQKYYGNGRLWRDGSLQSDVPFLEIQHLFRVKFTIVAQVNPHVICFFFRPKGSLHHLNIGYAGNPSYHRRGSGWRGGFVAASLVSLFLLEINKWLTFIREMELLPRVGGSEFSSIWLQPFEGNLTILPKIRWTNIRNFLVDPDYKRLGLFLDDGQSQTWRAVKPIANRMKIEKKISEFLIKTKL